MTLFRRLRDLRALRWSPRQLVWRVIDLTRMAYLAAESVVWTRPIVGDAEFVVSMTTFGSRIADAAFALQTIRRGRVRPQRIIFWLDDERMVASPTPFLRRLARAGLEIKHCEDLGAYKKQIPYAESRETHAVPLITCDDDVFYPRSWLQTLMAGYAQRPDVVNCARARQVTLDADRRFAPYDSWPMLRSTRIGTDVFPTGVSGVVYPPRLLDELRSRGRSFVDVAPRADDIWVHETAISRGFQCRQIADKPLMLRRIPGSNDGETLMKTNVAQGGNNEQMENCYTAGERSLIEESINR